jgi:YaiO family outer membrane protein
MNAGHLKHWDCILGACILAVAVTGISEVYAQSPSNVEIEAGANYRNLTAGYPNWAGAYLRAIAKAGSRDTAYFEVLRQREFGDTGTYFSVADSHTINDDWYMFAGVAGSDGGFFFPRIRVDAQLNKKWLAGRRLVTGIGGGYYKAKDAHHDSNLSVGGIYYFEGPWVIQGGMRWNRSMPGAVISRSQYVAVSQGRQGKHFIVLRGEAGREAYQALAPGASLVDFPSHGLTTTWKQWLGESWGFNVAGEYYKSDVYQRTGASLGIFKSF